MLIKKLKAPVKQNSDACSVTEYDFPCKDLGFAIANINGRYPDSGKVVNTKCDQMYYVISGSAVIHTAEGDFEINEEDCFYFEKNKWYWVEGNDLKVALPNSPAWFFEQYKEIPE